MKKKSGSSRKNKLNKRFMAYSAVAAAVLASRSSKGAIQPQTGVNETLWYNGSYDISFGESAKFKVQISSNTYTTKSGTMQYNRSYYNTYGYSTTTYGARIKTATFSRTRTISSYYDTTWGPYTYFSRSVSVQPQTGGAGFIGSRSYAQALPGGYLISNSKSFTNSGSSGNLAYSTSNRFTWTSGGQFKGTTAYLGLRFDIGGNTHYGWVRISIPSDVQSVNIYHPTYEDTPGLGILTGEEETSLAVSAIRVTAASIPSGITLGWSTQSETHNTGFIVERKDPGSADEAWTEIGSYKTFEELKGRGNASDLTAYSFTDKNVSEGKYAYRIYDVDIHGQKTLLQTLEVEHRLMVPETLALHNNFPNPFNPATTIPFDLPEQTHVTLNIYNVQGQRVEILADKAMDAGFHQIRWDASKHQSGTYFVELKVSDQRKVRRIVLMR